MPERPSVSVGTPTPKAILTYALTNRDENVALVILGAGLEERPPVQPCEVVVTDPTKDEFEEALAALVQVANNALLISQIHGMGQTHGKDYGTPLRAAHARALAEKEAETWEEAAFMLRSDEQHKITSGRDAKDRDTRSVSAAGP